MIDESEKKKILLKEIDCAIERLLQDSSKSEEEKVALLRKALQIVEKDKEKRK